MDFNTAYAIVQALKEVRRRRDIVYDSAWKTADADVLIGAGATIYDDGSGSIDLYHYGDDVEVVAFSNLDELDSIIEDIESGDFFYEF